MINETSLSGARERAEKAVDFFQWMLGLNLLMQTIFGILLIVSPSIVMNPLGIDAIAPWATIWGGLLLFIATFQLPGFIRPRLAWVFTTIGLVGRALMSLTYFLIGGGFVWIGLFDAAFTVLIGLALIHLFSTELRTRA